MVKIRINGKVIPKEDLYKHEMHQEMLKKIIANRSAGQKQKKGA